MVLVPDRDVVVVMNANYTNSVDETAPRESAIWELLERYVLSSI